MEGDRARTPERSPTMMFGMAPMGLFAWIGGLLVVIVLVAACLAYLSYLGPARGRSDAPSGDDAVELLRHRLATGEIDDEEYLRRRSALEDR
jgi:putative membrane protein